MSSELPNYPRKIATTDLTRFLDSKTVAANAVDLNIKLMQWRVLPSLQPEKMKDLRVLLLGAGTLGCGVARALMGWGCRRMTFVDAGKVSYSNPVRQSLFTHRDAAEGRKKATAAREAVEAILPDAEVADVVLDIPMPGHPHQSADVLRANLAKLQELIDTHDVVCMLTDSRESRWIPSLLVAAQQKDKESPPLGLTVALGFDSFLVSRQTYKSAVAACYFCNDVTAPADSLAFRTRRGRLPAMGKTAAVFIDGLPRLGAGVVYSADSRFRADIEAGLTASEEVAVSELAAYVGTDVALLRVWVLRRAAQSIGVPVGELTFCMRRFCVVEPSHVVVIAPKHGPHILCDFLMPVTKREKQLMLSTPVEDLVLPAIGTARSEFVVCPQPGDVPLTGERFLRHSGAHIKTEIIEEAEVQPDGTVVWWRSVALVAITGVWASVLHAIYTMLQLFCALYAIGLIDLGLAGVLVGPTDPAVNFWPWVLEPFRRGALFSVTILEGHIVPGVSLSPDWFAIKEVLYRLYALSWCKLVGGCLVSAVQVYSPGVDTLPVSTDLASAASGFVVMKYVVPRVLKAHYYGTFVLADKIYSWFPVTPESTGYTFPSLQAYLFGTFFYTALAAGDVDLVPFKPLGAQAKWSFVRHSGMFKSEPISDEFWDRPVVTFWSVRDKQIAPVGGGWLVHDSVMTAGHVYDAMKVLEACGSKLYVGRCYREVCNINNLYPYEPKLIKRPSAADLARNPIAGDFALISAPRNVAQLGLRLGRIGFAANNGDVVHSGHYRQEQGKWVFYRTFGTCQFGTPDILGYQHPGACFWTGESMPSASGFPLLNASRELVGVNIGALETDGRSVAVAAKASSIFRFFISRNETFFSKSKFGIVPQAPKPKKGDMPSAESFAQHSRKKEDDDDEANWSDPSTDDDDSDVDDETLSPDERRQLKEMDRADAEDEAHAKKHEGTGTSLPTDDDGTPAIPESEVKCRPKKVGQLVRIKEDYRPKYCACGAAVAIGACCAMCSYFWSHADKLELALTGMLSEEDQLRKERIKSAIESQVPLSPFESYLHTFDFVVAAGDGTLDQQCTVTRPGISGLASSVAVELLAALTQHEAGFAAPSWTGLENLYSSPLGGVPHQVRGYAAEYTLSPVETEPFSRCICCSPQVLQRYADEGMSFLEKVIADSSILEEISGLAEMKAGLREHEVEAFDDFDDL
eukprot:s2570_g4.t1